MLRKMAALSIQSKFKLNSGYEIPLLGFGVRCAAIPSTGAFR